MFYTINSVKIVLQMQLPTMNPPPLPQATGLAGTRVFTWWLRRIMPKALYLQLFSFRVFSADSFDMNATPESCL